MAKRPTNTRPEQTAPAKKAKTVETAAPKGILKKANGASTSIGSKNAAAKVEHKEVKSNGDRKGKGKATGSSVLRLPPTPAAPPKPATAFEIVAGSYERILYGLHCIPSGAGSDTTVDMQPVFQFPAHLTGVKCASASPNGRWLATGSTDEVVKVWDLRRRKEVGGLIGHEGDITCLVFPSDKYLVSTSADGTICLFRTKDWSLLRRFKGHKGRVNYVAVHPEGRVALTVSKDRCLRLWDLLGKSTAKGSSSTRLGAEADLVRWNTKGDRFAVILDRELRVYSTDMSLIKDFRAAIRFHDVAFVDYQGSELLLVACEDGKVRIYKDITASEDNAEDDKEEEELSHIAELVGHSNRVKSLSVVDVLGQKLCATASSDGTMKVYTLSALNLASDGTDIQSIEAINTYDTKGSRLTCMTAVAVKDDRTTTYAESVASMGSDSSDMDSEDEEDEQDISDREQEEAEEEAEAIIAQLNGEITLEDDEDDGEGDSEEGDVNVEDEEEAEEWGGIEAEG